MVKTVLRSAGRKHTTMNKKETFDSILRQIPAFQRVPQSERKHVIRRALRHPLFWGTFLALILFWLGAFVSVFAATGIDYTFSLAPKYNFLDILTLRRNTADLDFVHQSTHSQFAHQAHH